MMAPREWETKSPSNKSTGPTSAAGKETVSRNALVHGLSSHKHVALPGEEDACDKYCNEMIEALAPVGVIERSVAQDIAEDRWRLARARAMENALFSRIVQDQPKPLDRAAALAEAWIDASQGLQKVAVYASRLQRQVERNTAYLESLQAKRKAEHAQKLEEAILLTQFAEANSETYNPAPDFPSTGAPGEFVYSAPEIARLIARAARLGDAKILFAAA